MIRTPLLFVTFLLAFIGCSQSQPQTQNSDVVLLVTPKVFSEQLTSEKGILLDVRTPAEWKKGHLKNARHLDLFRDDFEEELTKLDTNATIYVYCAAGGRSAEAAEMLHQKGFHKVVDMDGGFMRWKSEGFPVEN